MSTDELADVTTLGLTIGWSIASAALAGFVVYVFAVVYRWSWSRVGQVAAGSLVALVLIVVSPLLAVWIACSRAWRRHHDAPTPGRVS